MSNLKTCRYGKNCDRVKNGTCMFYHSRCIHGANCPVVFTSNSLNTGKIRDAPQHKTINNSLPKKQNAKNNSLELEFSERHKNRNKELAEYELKYTKLCNEFENQQKWKDKFNEVSTENKMLQSILTLSKQKMELLKKEMENKSEQLKEYKDKISCLERDLANTQQHILDTTSIVEVKQKLLTVEECLLKYQNIKDQIYSDTFSVFKKYLQSKYPSYQKYYIHQMTHELLFKTLIECYKSVNNYKNNMFDSIAKELNMKQTILNNDDDSKNDQYNSDEHIQNTIYDGISKLFTLYFKNHYQDILKIDLIKNEIINYVNKNFGDIVRDITDENCCASLLKYITKCCELCWILLLQDPVLVIHPITWVPDKNIVYDTKIHARVIGSNKASKKISYYVWPILAQNKQYLPNQKIKILLRNQFYPKK